MIGKFPAWSYSCEGCERCINICPRKAIQSSALRVGLLVAFTAVVEACPLRPLLEAALPWLPPSAFAILWLPLSIFLGFLVLRLADLTLVALSLVPGLRPVLSFGWTRWFRRYEAPR